MNRVEQSIREYAADLDRASIAMVSNAPTRDPVPALRRRRRSRTLAAVAVAMIGLAGLILAVTVAPWHNSQPPQVAVADPTTSTTPASSIGDCPRATFDPSGSPDALPYANLVTKTAVDSVITQSGFRIVAQYHATDLSASSIVSNAIATHPSGGSTVTRHAIYIINVTLASAAACPAAPALYDGVPLIFHLRPRPDSAHPTTTGADACDAGAGNSPTFTAWDHATSRPVLINRAYYCRRVAELTPPRESHLSGDIWIANGRVVVEYHRVTDVTTVDAQGRSIGTATESKDTVPIDELPVAIQQALHK